MFQGEAKIRSRRAVSLSVVQLPSRFRWVRLEVVSEKRKALQNSVSRGEDLGITIGIKADPESTNGKGDSKKSTIKLETIRMKSDSDPRNASRSLGEAELEVGLYYYIKNALYEVYYME